jgi:ClpP class serine protease
VFDGIAIHTALAMSKAHVTTFNTGIAASAASYIMMAGDTIKTARNAMWMLHDASGMVWGNATACRAQAELLDKLSLNIADMYAMQAGGTKEEWFARLENTETWYTGEEALSAGLADEITDPDEDPDEQTPASNRLSFAVFNYAGRAEAPPPEIPPAAEDEESEDPPTHVELPPAIPPVVDDPDDDVANTMLAFLMARLLSTPQKGAAR